MTPANTSAEAGWGSALEYLSELEAHNDREWFAATKRERAQALAAFDVLVAALQERIGQFDPSVLDHDPKKLTFKLTISRPTIPACAPTSGRRASFPYR